MPSVELSKLQGITPARGLSETDRNAVSTPAPSGKSEAAGSAKPGVSIEIGGAGQAAASQAVDAATPPLDNDRVAEIREALRDGSYPLVPAEIADAMIAAQLSFGIRP